MKILSNDMYILLIDEEAEIKGDDFCVNLDRRISHLPLKVEKRNIGGYGSDKYYFSHKKVIAYRKLNENAKELDLPELPPFEETDVEKLADNYAVDVQKVHPADSFIAKQSYIEGYKAAQSKQFSLEDMKKAYKLGTNYANVEYPLNKDVEVKFKQLISTQQLPKEFIPEYYTHKYDYGIGRSCMPTKHLKTITNSEGKEVIQGKWIY